MIFLFLIAPAQAEPGVVLTVSVHGAASDDGAVMCQVFRAPDGFPDVDAKATAYAAARIDKGQATCLFANQLPGRIAVAVFHDANGNARLDTNLVGWPVEAFAFSNGAEAGLFGPPRWEEAALSLASSPLTLTVELSP